jgi:hypothetical protein
MTSTRCAAPTCWTGASASAAGRARVAGQGQATINLASTDAVERYDGAIRHRQPVRHAWASRRHSGRDFLAEDEQPGAAPVVILSHDLWRNSFRVQTR